MKGFFWVRRAAEGHRSPGDVPELLGGVAADARATLGCWWEAPLGPAGPACAFHALDQPRPAWRRAWITCITTGLPASGACKRWVAVTVKW